jgi:DNA polymerase V
MIGLLDANNFFVSCERVFRPDLLKRPVAVLSNNDGNVVARSNEVKAMGVPMGAPYHKIKKLLEVHNTAVFSSNFALYGDISSRMMMLVESLVPRVEIYSIDEVFIDFAGIKDPQALAHHLKAHIWQALGVPISVGIAKTKTLAKVANHMAKKRGEYQSVCLLNKADQVDEALKNLPVKEIWGIGYRLTERLKIMGIETALQLKQIDPRWMRQNFTVVGERLVRELNGMSCLALEDVQNPKKSIQVSRSFGKPIREFEELRAMVATYASRLAQKIRRDELKTRSLLIEIRTNPFRPDQPQYSNSAVINLPCPVEDDVSLIKAATKGLESIFKRGFAYHKAGVMALDLVSRDQKIQLDMFAALPTEDPRNISLASAMDNINHRFGRGTVYQAACGRRLSWRDHKKKVSPSYTTSWLTLPRVLAV